jgi:hypothetical protein
LRSGRAPDVGGRFRREAVAMSAAAVTIGLCLVLAGLWRRYFVLNWVPGVIT